MRDVQPGKYRHFKGGEYEVLFTARDSETLEDVVVYKALYDSDEFGRNAVWVRPKKEFCETVTRNGKTIARFARIR